MMNSKYYLNNVPYNSASERQEALRVSIPALKNAPVNNGRIYNPGEEIKGTASPSRFKDVMLGFFGWVIFSNLAMLTLLFAVFSSLGKLAGGFLLIGMVLLLMISIIALLWHKKSWAFLGVAAALTVNFGLWMTVGDMFRSSMKMEDMIMFTLNPFPLGFLLFFC
jgi:hypothetical protein